MGGDSTGQPREEAFKRTAVLAQAPPEKKAKTGPKVSLAGEGRATGTFTLRVSGALQIPETAARAGAKSRNAAWCGFLEKRVAGEAHVHVELWPPGMAAAFRRRLCPCSPRRGRSAWPRLSQASSPDVAFHDIFRNFNWEESLCDIR